jgi:hypothetical protein
MGVHFIGHTIDFIGNNMHSNQDLLFPTTVPLCPEWVQSGKQPPTLQRISGKGACRAAKTKSSGSQRHDLA